MDAGLLKEGWRIQRDPPGYGPRGTVEELHKDLAAAAKALTRDDVLDNISIAWLITTAISGARLYRESKLTLPRPDGRRKILSDYLRNNPTTHRPVPSLHARKPERQLSLSLDRDDLNALPERMDVDQGAGASPRLGADLRRTYWTALRNLGTHRSPRSRVFLTRHSHRRRCPALRRIFFPAAKAGRAKLLTRLELA